MYYKLEQCIQYIRMNNESTLSAKIFPFKITQNYRMKLSLLTQLTNQLDNQQFGY